MRRFFWFVPVLLLLLWSGREPVSSPSHPAGLWGQLPLSFEANRGQLPADTDFLARSEKHTVLVDDREIRFHGTERTVALRPLNSQSSAAQALEPQEGVVNYLLGPDPAQWKTGIPTFGKVRYPELYPGVDLVCYGNSQQFEYDLVLEPGADPSAIRFEVDTEARLSLDDSGNLVADGEVLQAPAFAYQTDSEGRRVPVEVGYELKGNQLAFALGEYDPGSELVIDPIVYSTFLGGPGEDRAQDVAVDAAGNAYIVGFTQAGFPTTAGSAQTAFGGGVFDAFVSKLNPTGTALVYSTFIGGPGDDMGQAIAVDGAGVVTIAGSAGGGFPTTAGVLAPATLGAQDAFVSRLSADGSSLVYSTYFGGIANDSAAGIAVDGAGNAYVAGRTEGFIPTTAGVAQNAFGGSSDAFVIKLNPTATVLTYSTFFGGTGAEQADDIAVDAAGNAYFTGLASDNTFPVSAGVVQAASGGGTDAFAVKLNPTGSLNYSTFLGGAGNDDGRGIAVDAGGNAYLTGQAFNGFPTTAGVVQTAFGGGALEDAYVAKLNPTGTALVYSTFLGGAGAERGEDIAVDGMGRAFLTGGAENGFPLTAGAFDTTHNGDLDAFVTRLNDTGTALEYSSFVGNTGGDLGRGIAVDGGGNAFVVGEAAAGFPTTPGALDSTFGGGGVDGFAAKFNTNPATPMASFSVAPPTAQASGVEGTTVHYNLFVSNTSTNGNVDSYAAVVSGNAWPTTVTGPTQALNPGLGVPITVSVSIPAGAGAGATDTATVTVSSVSGTGGTPVNVTLTTTATPALQLAVTPNGAQVSGLALVPIPLMLMVTHSGPTADTFTITGTANQVIFTLPQTTLNLAPNVPQSVPVTVLPLPYLPANSVREVRLVVTSTTNPALTGTAVIQVTNTPTSQPGITQLGVPRVRSRQRDEATLVYIHNTGNQTDSYDLVVLDDKGFTLEIDSSVGPIERGELESIEFAVTAPAVASIGFHDLPIRITARGTGEVLNTALQVEVVRGAVNKLTGDGGTGDVSCFIATAAYGSYQEPHVMVLRQFRDRFLLTHAPGRLFVKAYYAASPPLADWIAQREWARSVSRVLLTPLFLLASLLVNGYGLPSLLLLLLGGGLWRRRRLRLCA